MEKQEKERLTKLYHNVQNQDREHFLTEMRYFREVMCSSKYSIEQKDNAFENVAQSYFRCNITDADIVAFTALTREWDLRREMEELHQNKERERE